MVADEPVPAVRLATVLAPADRPGRGAARRARRRVPRRARRSTARLRAARAPATAGGSTPRRRYADVVGRFVLDGQTARLTQAALETLAVDRLPPAGDARPGLGGPRGQRRRRRAHAHDPRSGRRGGHRSASGAVLYGTTGYFLERMGLSSLDELPPLAPYLPDIDSFEGVDQAIGDSR